MACEGACARGEVARRAANLIAHLLAKDNTVRICLGGAFTKDGGQRDLVRRSKPAIAIEGCFISCASRMMNGVLPGFKPVIAQADTYYENALPFGIDEVPEEELQECARIVAEAVLLEYITDPAMMGGVTPQKWSAHSSSGTGKASCYKTR